VKVRKTYFSSVTLEVTPGPEFHLLSKLFQQRICETKGIIQTESNRMAYLLKGFEGFSAHEIITAPVQPGTVQLTPSGKCVILMRDAQTTGGYARILQLTEGAINVLAQKRAGEQVQFKLI
jgi:allophanate hydrolase subunit 2